MRLFLVALTAALLLAVPASASAARCESDHPIYGLKATGGARCGSALVIASRLTRRFDTRSDFSGSRSRVRISQTDARGTAYRCGWQMASSRRDIVIWACSRSSGALVTWIWRLHRLSGS